MIYYPFFTLFRPVFCPNTWALNHQNQNVNNNIYKDGSGSFSSKHFNQINIHHRTPENKESNPEPGQVEEPRDRSQSNSEAENCKFSINVGSKQINVGSKQNEETSSTKQSKPVKISLLDNQDVDSDETLTEEGPKERRQRQENEREEDDHEYLGKKKRQVPPPLADWNRSQSFPPGNGELQKQSRDNLFQSNFKFLTKFSLLSNFFVDFHLIDWLIPDLGRRVTN